MGKAGRFACIFVPLVATAATAVIILLSVFIGQNIKNSAFDNNRYFIRVDTRNITTGKSLIGIAEGFIHINTTAGEIDKPAGLPDFYQAGFWGYCTGSINESTNAWTVNNCSKATTFFTFDLISIINDTIPASDNLTFPTAVTDAFKGVRPLSRTQFICFVVGIVATFIEFVVGWFGLFSRIGSCVTTLVANVAFVALLGGAVINVILYAAMTTAFNASSKEFGVRAHLNTHVYRLMFLGVIISFGAAVFWLFSSCCCSGRRDRVVKYRDVGEKRSGGKNGSYERVSSPYGHAEPFLSGPDPAHQMQTYGQTSYEPMRHQPV